MLDFRNLPWISGSIPHGVASEVLDIRSIPCEPWSKLLMKGLYRGCTGSLSKSYCSRLEIRSFDPS